VFGEVNSYIEEIKIRGTLIAMAFGRLSTCYGFARNVAALIRSVILVKCFVLTDFKANTL